MISNSTAKTSSALCVTLLLALLGACVTVSASELDPRNPNNEAVTAIKEKKWQIAITKLVEAIQRDPTFYWPRSNLVVAHRSWALELKAQGKIKDSLREFHEASYALRICKKMRETPYDLHSDLTKDIDALLLKLGKDPQSFAHRVELGDEYVSLGEFPSAAIEYEAALQIRHDPEVENKLRAIDWHAGQRLILPSDYIYISNDKEPDAFYAAREARKKRLKEAGINYGSLEDFLQGKCNAYRGGVD
jgi:tetratricopeptide (TPR) repeat protein